MLRFLNPLTILCSLILISSCSIFGPRSIRGIKMSLSPFKSDGCSGYFDGDPITKKNEWLHCCFAHDMRYWVGGSKKEKEEADYEINQCVAKTSNRTHGELVELGVLIGGGPQTGLPWRWGYGWSVEVPFFIRELRHIEAFKEQFPTLARELNNWRTQMNDDQIFYIEEKIFEMKNLIR